MHWSTEDTGYKHGWQWRHYATSERQVPCEIKVNEDPVQFSVMWICNTACLCSLASVRGWGCRERSRKAAPRCPIGMTTAFAEELGSKAPWAFESLMDKEQTWADLSPWHSLAKPVFSFFSLLFFILRKILEPVPMKTSRILDAFLSWEPRHGSPAMFYLSGLGCP